MPDMPIPPAYSTHPYLIAHPNSSNPLEDLPSPEPGKPSLAWELINKWEISPDFRSGLSHYVLIYTPRSKFEERAYKGFIVRDSTIFSLIPYHNPSSTPPVPPEDLTVTVISFRKHRYHPTGYAIYKHISGGNIVLP